MKTPFSLLSLLLAVALLVPSVQAQQKIGYVNSAKIFQELPAAQDAQRRIDAMGKPIQDTLEAMQKELAVAMKNIRKKNRS